MNKQNNWYTPAADSAVQATLLDYGVRGHKNASPLIRLVLNDHDEHPYAYVWNDRQSEYEQIQLPELEMTLAEMKAWAIAQWRMME